MLKSSQVQRRLEDCCNNPSKKDLALAPGRSNKGRESIWERVFSGKNCKDIRIKGPFRISGLNDLEKEGSLIWDKCAVHRVF
jgi:hypothetical protein